MIRCYKYWAEPASADDARKLSATLRLAGDYRRTLVEIENRARALQRALWAQPMRLIPPEDREAWRAAGGEAILKAWTQTDEYRERHARIRAETTRIGRWARRQASSAGLHYGTYWLVEDAVDRAIRTTRWQQDVAHQAPRRVGAPIDANAKPTVEAILGGHTRLRLSPETYALGARVDGYRTRADGPSFNRGGRLRPARLRQVSIRVGSEGRDPIWAHLHVLMEPSSRNRTRPLPADGRICQAWAQRTRATCSIPGHRLTISADTSRVSD